MPEEKSSHEIGGDPVDNASAQTPIQSGGNQGVPHQTADPKPRDNEDSTVRLQKDIRGAEKWLIGIGIATVLINTGIALIYLRQLNQMRIATTASTQAVNLAQDSLITSDSHFNRALHQTINQTAASMQAANAAKGAADIAKQALRISERAYITTATPELNQTSDIVSLSLPNSGHIPSGKAIILIHEGTAGIADSAASVGKVVPLQERHWQESSINSIPPGTPFESNVLVPHLDSAKMNSGHQSIFIAGVITYNDGFTEDGSQKWQFCWGSIFVAKAKQILWAPCDPSAYIAILSKADGYPSKENYMQ